MLRKYKVFVWIWKVIAAFLKVDSFLKNPMTKAANFQEPRLRSWIKTGSQEGGELLAFCAKDISPLLRFYVYCC